MKTLTKLSIATLVALGAFSSANAASLEESIKGVDISGLVRYRVQNDKHENYDKGDKHRLSASVTLSVPVAENVTSVLTAKYDGYENAQTKAAEDKQLKIAQAYFQYAQNAFILKAGKMQLPTPWNENSWDGDFGNGIFAAYTGVDSWTFAMASYFNTTIDKRISIEDNGVEKFLQRGYQDVYAAAAIGSFGPLNAQVWLGKVQEIIDYAAFLELSINHMGIDARAQVQQTKLKSNFAKDYESEDTKGIFWAGEAGYTFAGLRVGAGYIHNDKKQGIYTLSADGSHIGAGQQLYAEIANTDGAKTWFAKANYEFGDFGFGGGYAKAKADGDKFGKEWYLEGSYAYTKNFSFYGYYSDMKNSQSVSEERDFENNKQIRFQATYTF